MAASRRLVAGATAMLRSGPTRRAALRRGSAAVLAVTVMTVATTTHRRGLELAGRWGSSTQVLVVSSHLHPGDELRGRVHSARAPTHLVPDGHLEAIPEGARAGVELHHGEILTGHRLEGDPASTGQPMQRGRAVIPVPLLGHTTAPATLAVGDTVDVIAPAPGPGGSGGTRRVADGALVRSLDETVVSLEVTDSDVTDLAEALLGGPVVLVVVASSGGPSAAGRGDVVDDE